MEARTMASLISWHPAVRARPFARKAVINSTNPFCTARWSPPPISARRPPAKAGLSNRCSPFFVSVCLPAGGR